MADDRWPTARSEPPKIFPSTHPSSTLLDRDYALHFEAGPAALPQPLARLSHRRSPQTCHVELRCGGTEIYPGSGAYTRCLSSAPGGVVGEDTSMDDGDPAMRIDTRSGRVVVRARGGIRDRSVTVELGDR
jgi:hypothetical protein